MLRITGLQRRHKKGHGQNRPSSPFFFWWGGRGTTKVVSRRFLKAVLRTHRVKNVSLGAKGDFGGPLERYRLIPEGC